MAKYRDEIETVIRARDESAAELRKAEAARREHIERSNGLQREQTDLAKSFGGQMVGTALRATAAAGAIELALGGVNVGLKAIKGDAEGAAEALESLPVLGGLARQTREFLGEITGVNDEVERLRREGELLRQNSEIELRIAVVGREEVERAELAIEKLRATANELESAPGSRSAVRREEERAAAEREAERARVAALRRVGEAAKPGSLDNERQRVTELKDEIAELEGVVNSGGLSRGFRELIGDPDKSLADARRELRLIQNALDSAGSVDRERARINAEFDESERERRRVYRVQDAEAERLRQLAVVDAESELAELRARNRGDALGAELESIRRTAAERIRAAEAAGNAELARIERVAGAERQAQARREEAERQQQRERDALYDAMRQRVEVAREETDERREQLRLAEDRIAAERGGLPELDQNRFLTGVADETLARDRERLRPFIERRDEARAQVDAAERQVQATEQMKDSVDQVVGVLGTLETVFRDSPLLQAGVLSDL